MPSLRRSLVLGSLAGLLLTPASALANPATDACNGKKSGDPCTQMTMSKGPDGSMQRGNVPGVCQPDECCDLDYSKGSPPQTTCHACLACKEGGPALPPPAAEGGDVAAGNGDPGPAEPARVDEPPAPAPSEQRGCRTGGETPGGWALGGLLLALGVAARRRRATVV